MKLNLLIASGLALMAIGVGLIFSIPVGMEEYTVENVPVIVEPEPEPVTLESRLLFGGDTYWGRSVERYHAGDYEYPFSGLNTLDKEKYEAWIVNVECPITDQVVSFQDQWEAIQFNCQPEYLDEASKWFDVVSLANNHTDNVRGQEGLDVTRTNLEEAGIQHFGHYEPGVLEDLCEIVSVDARLIHDDDSIEMASLPIAMCGYHGVFRLFTDEEIEHISTVTDQFITISMPHAGGEYEPTSDQIREDAYRSMIDFGADAVIGNHPHWVQNTEAYKGKLIAYSMGNLVFDQQFSNEVTRSAMIDMTITLEYTDELRQYLQLASDCTDFKDTCLQDIVGAGLAKPDATLSYDVVATKTSNYVTKKSTVERPAILERLDWTKTLAELQ